tara:strand:+ start:363 stop:671 length:309 start_codon:yes stop_codon:yes gene_type:complete
VVVLVVVMELSVDQEAQVVVEQYRPKQVVAELLVKEMMEELVLPIQEDQDQEQITVVELVAVLLQQELLEHLDLIQDQQEAEQEELDLQLLLLLDLPLNLFT